MKKTISVFLTLMILLALAPMMASANILTPEMFTGTTWYGEYTGGDNSDGHDVRRYIDISMDSCDRNGNIRGIAHITPIAGSSDAHEWARYEFSATVDLRTGAFRMQGTKLIEAGDYWNFLVFTGNASADSITGKVSGGNSRTFYMSRSSDWSRDEVNKAYSYDIVPDRLKGKNLTEPITRAEFAAVSYKIYEFFSSTPAQPAAVNPYTDTNDADVLKATNLDIVNGYGNGSFGPNDKLSREQCATMLTRAYKKISIPGWTLAKDTDFALDYAKPAPFADDHLISSWARDSVYFMAANRIIEGMGNGFFAPYNTTSREEAENYATATREQALAIAVRMADNLR